MLSISLLKLSNIKLFKKKKKKKRIFAHLLKKLQLLDATREILEKA